MFVPSPESPSVKGDAGFIPSAGLFNAYCPIPRLDSAAVKLLAAYEDSGLLVEPGVRRSVAGELRTTLRVQYAYEDVGGYRLHLRTYEGTVPGPTLRVKPGDVLRISLVNDLPPNRDEEPMFLNHPHHFNTTNFHFHGSHVSPGGISDNILREMEPGQSYDVEIAIPRDHPRGMYWYHPHHHGGADIQVASGMAGAIIIEGDFDGVPEIAAAEERVLVVSEVVFDAQRSVEDFETLFPETATRFLTINGQRVPTIQLRPGEVQRWRLLHAGYQDDILLKLDGHTLHPVAYDGISLPRMGSLDSMLLAPGQRAEFLVRAGAPGLYEMHALPNDQGYPSPTGPLAHVIVAGDPLPMGLPTALPSAPFDDIRDAEITNTREVVFSAVTPENDAAGHYEEFSFLVDGKLFDENRVDHYIPLGAALHRKAFLCKAPRGRGGMDPNQPPCPRPHFSYPYQPIPGN